MNAVNQIFAKMRKKMAASGTLRAAHLKPCNKNVLIILLHRTHK